MANENDIKIDITGDDLSGYEAALPTGQKYRGKSKDELLNEIVKAQVHSSQTLQEKERELQETRRILAEREQERTRQTRTQDDGGEPSFDREAFNKKYWELINTDPMAALELANQVYYGVDDPRGAFKKSVVVADFVSDAVATREFLKDNPDFPANKENGERLVDETLAAGLELTSHNLERTWKTLKRESTITPLTAEQIAEETERLNGSFTAGDVVTKRRTPPPNPAGDTREDATNKDASQEDTLNEFATLSRSKREEILRSRGMM